MLVSFASVGVEFKSLARDKWTIGTLAIGGTLISPTDPIAALALALSLPESHDKPLIVNMTFAVVAFSVLVQGSTIAKLFQPDYLKGLLK